MAYYDSFEIKQYDSLPECNSNSKEIRDLILGISPIGIKSDGPVIITYQTEYFNTKASYSVLTNGVKAKEPVYTDPAFFHFTGAVGRSVTFELKGLSTVTGISVGFLREDGVGVKLPRRMNVLLSENGRDWQKVVRQKNVFCKHNPECVKVDVDFDTPFKAKYVIFEFDVHVHCWVEYMSVFGCDAILPNAKDIVPTVENEEDKPMHVNKYPDYSDFLGVHNLLLAYNCVPPENEGENRLGYATVEHFLPHVGYINQEGNTVDTFFDAFLFLPYSRFTYSALYKCADGWKLYADNVFAENANLDALNQATAITGEKLGIPDLKVKVFFSILCSKVHYGQFPEKFGSFDGKRDLDMDTLEDRKTALKWIIDEQYNRYKKGSYTHTELGGFYWFEEDINYSDEFELDLIKYAREYVHSLGLKLFWIPYYQASGFQDWQENGFDIACMQPNYAFNKMVPVSRLYDNAETTKLLGLCVEIEIGGHSDLDVEKYHNYIDCGAETGFMKTVKMYYQGGIPGDFYASYKSEDKFTRTIYDDTYLFAKEKYIPRRQR